MRAGILLAMLFAQVALSAEIQTNGTEDLAQGFDPAAVIASEEAATSQWLKSWTAEKRKPANLAPFTERDFNKAEDMVAFRNEFLKTTTADGLEKLLKDSHEPAAYAKASPARKYFLAQLHPLLALRGIVWKLRPLFERPMGKHKFIGNPATQGIAVQFVRQVATGIETFFPTDQWRAGFDFLTIPSKEMSSEDQFKTVYQFQVYLEGPVRTAIREGINRISEIIKSQPNQYFVWDNQIGYGSGAFADGMNRFIGYGPAEMYVARAAMFRMLHALHLFSAYNQDALISVQEELGRKFGVNTALGDNDDIGMTSQERVEIIRRYNRSKRFMKRHATAELNGIKIMGLAHQSLTLFAADLNSAHAFLTGPGARANPALAVNPGKYQADIDNMLSKGVSDLVAMVQRGTTLRSLLTGKMVWVDVPNFYVGNPPADMGAFLPTADGFDTSRPKDLSTPGRDGELSYRNYRYGRAIRWNYDAWKSYVAFSPQDDRKMEQRPSNDQFLLEARQTIGTTYGGALGFGLAGMFVR
ncbi:MAG: hypothetical protein K2X47_05855 [Bdellovibrionales bacterium]|nr:hypothetical protein [Bdellovibrionales bacterium]